MSKYQVRVTSLPAEIVPLVKAMRVVADAGLTEAKALSDYLTSHIPCVIVTGISREVADHIVQLLTEAGAEGIVEKSSLVSPMLLCPDADQCRRWSWLVGPTPVKPDG